MKIYVTEDKGERSCVDMNNYIEKVVDTVMAILTATKKDLDTNDEFLTAWNLLMCKNKLTGLLSNLTDTDTE